MVKVQIIKETRIKLPEISILGEQSFKEYLRWGVEVGTASIPYNEFKAGVFGGVTFKERPREKVETPLQVNGIEMIVVTSPTHTRPAYGEILDEFENYLFFLQERVKKGLRQEGIRTMEGKFYISADLLLEKLQKDIETMLKGKEDIKQELYFTAPEENIPEILPVVYGRNYSAFTEFNAREAHKSKNFVKEGNSRANKFKSILLEDSLKTLGIEKPSDVEESVELAYPFEYFTFRHLITPESTPQNKQLMDKLIKPAPKRLTTKSTIGEYVLLQIWKNQAQVLTEKKLIDEDFLKDYNPRLLGERVFISLEGVIKRFTNYRKEFIKPSLNQHIYAVIK